MIDEDAMRDRVNRHQVAMTEMEQQEFDDFTRGERQALLEVRSFIIKHGTREVDSYCAQRLHDIRMDGQKKNIRKTP